MACASPIRQRIEWMWKSNVDSFSSSEMPQWSFYSDVETAIIEEAYAQNLPKALLDDYHINFEQFMQISNKDWNKQRPVKRMVMINNEQHQEAKLREERFMPSPLFPSMPFTERYQGSVFLFDFLKYDGIKLVEMAAEGLINEGKSQGKQKQGEWMSQQLLNVNKEAMKNVWRENVFKEKVWQCCASLYCMESFLYKKLNEYMRLSGEQQHEELLREKKPILGPFAFLLDRWNENQIPNVHETMTVYRGAELSPNLIKQFKAHHEKHPLGFDTSLQSMNKPQWIEFPAFTSTSRNRKLAEQFNNANVLFIIEIGRFDGFDVSPYSMYENEEEILIKPNFLCGIRSIEFKKKWIIGLHIK